ncbi:hypothetical protein GGR34_001517 [Microvirga flocculans]|uniref:Uncharacterized protein n=1 Tax=Microvirga flocculans TaxID=217168 RepID=A0A7W6N7V0_9HYPH|nr:hypothetical protein [Microvirga flocculans]
MRRRRSRPNRSAPSSARPLLEPARNDTEPTDAGPGSASRFRTVQALAYRGVYLGTASLTKIEPDRTSPERPST